MSTRPTSAPPTPVTLRSPSSLALIAAHLWPMAGVLFLGWNIGDVLLLAWGEAAAMGVFTLIKVAMVDRRWFLLRGPFVLIAIAFVLAGLLGIVLAIAHEVEKLRSGSYSPQDFGALARELAPPLAMFVASHLSSFVLDFVGRREYEHRSSEEIGKAFFKRVAPIFVVAFLAAFVVSAFGDVPVLLLLVVIAKLGMDLLMHLGEHQMA